MYHTTSESLQTFTFPKFRDEHLKPPWSAILASSSSDMGRITPCCSDNGEIKFGAEAGANLLTALPR